MQLAMMKALSVCVETRISKAATENSSFCTVLQKIRRMTKDEYIKYSFKLTKACKVLSNFPRHQLTVVKKAVAYAPVIPGG